MKKHKFIIDAHSSYTTVAGIDTNSYNTHILENVTIIDSNGEKEECQKLICNNQISYDTGNGMGKVEDWITDEEDWEGICPKCRKEWDSWYKKESET